MCGVIWSMYVDFEMYLQQVWKRGKRNRDEEKASERVCMSLCCVSGDLKNVACEKYMYSGIGVVYEEHGSLVVVV